MPNVSRRSLLAWLWAGTIGAEAFDRPVQAVTEAPIAPQWGNSIAHRAGQAQRVRVGRSPDALPSIAEAARLAQDGDTVEIEAGVYSADTAVWQQRRLSIRAVGGPVRLLAKGQAAEGKAIWVLRNGDFDIQGIEFSGCSVPARNGAGIRFERGRLRLDRCRFLDSDTGLLTGNDPAAELEVQRCEFSRNGANDGLSHDLYVGGISSLRVVASYFSRARAGHLLKSRARSSVILYSRLTDESGGSSSYEVDLPNGGLAILMGNLIVQDPGSLNHAIVSFGAEGYRWPRNDLVMVHNTVVNRHPGDARFVRVARPPVAPSEGSAPEGRATLHNNVFVGRGRFDNADDDAALGNVRANERAFRAADAYDFTPVRIPALRADAQPAAPIEGQVLVPDAQYRHPLGLEALATRAPKFPGAFQQ